MDYYCAQLDVSRKRAWLETDRPENVTFYRRYGFETTRQASVIGVENYFMCRPSHPAIS
jgi:hypothetical protein